VGWTLLAAAVALLWACLLAKGLIALAQMTDLRTVDPAPESGARPKLSVIVPARDEEESLRACLESLAAQDLGGLEVIVVDDRSTDATGQIADEVASAAGERFNVVHLTDLPDGWLGKCHALSVGARRASGSILLFTDGDVLFERTVLSRAMALVDRTGADMLIVIPDLILDSFGEEVFAAAFGALAAAAISPSRLMNPRSTAYAGTGAFNLVRRSTYDASGGHEPLRLEVIDDYHLGRRVKRVGGGILVALGSGLLRVRWQRGVLGHIRGLEKNMFAAMDYSVVRAALAGGFWIALNWWPWLGLLAGPPGARALSGATALAVSLTMALACRRFMGLSPLVGPLLPVGALMLTVALVRSVWVTLRQGGVRWRGTLYPLSDLRAFSRAED
jgi:glycosyltransferase involved in cell wall biosynthesis